MSSSESVAPSRPVYNLDPVTSSEVTRGEMRSLSESNEAMPSLPTLEPPSTDPASLSVADENILEVDEDADVPQVIEIASDSDEVSEEEKEDDEEDDYSGLEDVEEDSRALQFSFVQSSGPDPVHDVLSADEALDMQEEEDSNEASEAAPSSTISLSTADTPWAHIAGNTEAAPAASSSSTNVRGIRRIKRQPKKE